MRLIYLDNHATTGVDPQALEAMLPWLSRAANPASPHAVGRRAAEVVDAARGHVAKLVNAHPREVIFTSGATEANNLALQGFMRHRGRGRVVTTHYEHESVRQTCARLMREGHEVEFVWPKPDGVILPEDIFVEVLRKKTDLVSVMWANNEVGTVNDIVSIGEFCHKHGVVLHVDASQAAGKIPVDFRKAHVGMLSMSAHKLHGPQGVGALVVSKSKPRVQLEALFEGGGQERGLRSGTVNVAGVVGFGQAVLLADLLMEPESRRIAELRDRLLHLLKRRVPDILVNGCMGNRLPGNLNVSVLGVHGLDLVRDVADRLAISTGSACHTGHVEPSHVLMAMGIAGERLDGAIRFGLSRFTTEEEIEEATGIIAGSVEKLRAGVSTAP